MSSTILGLVCLLGAHGLFGQAPGTVADTVRRKQAQVLHDSTIRALQVHRIFIVGNRLTRDHIILREVTLRTGDIVFSNELPGVLDLARKRLINTRLFNTVDIRVLDSDNNLIDILIDLDERWYTFPSPIFELSDRNFNEWWQNYDHDLSRVNYGLRLYQYNVRGRNETLRLTGQFGFVRRFDLNYRVPYIDRKQKQGLAFDFDYAEAKNLAVRTVDHKLDFVSHPHVLKTTQGVALTYTYRNSFYQFHSLRVDYRRNEILQDTVISANENYLPDTRRRQQFGILTYSFTSDHRDYFAYPLKGHHFNFYIQKSGLGFNDDLNKIDVSLSYSKFIPLKRNYYFSANVVTTVSGPDDIPYANYTALGFKKQFVRGYEVYVIEGPMFFLAKTTFKKLLFSRSYRWEAMPIEQFRHIPIQLYIKTYADAAYVENYPYYQVRGLNTTLTNKVISSIGGGLDLVSSYDLVFRFEYTLNSMGYHGFFFHVRREF